jgi:hypothetical protein
LKAKLERRARGLEAEIATGCVHELRVRNDAVGVGRDACQLRCSLLPLIECHCRHADGPKQLTRSSPSCPKHWVICGHGHARRHSQAPISETKRAQMRTRAIALLLRAAAKRSQLVCSSSQKTFRSTSRSTEVVGQFPAVCVNGDMKKPPKRRTPPPSSIGREPSGCTGPVRCASVSVLVKLRMLFVIVEEGQP